jgi:excisionase family DNA binding protein
MTEPSYTTPEGFLTMGEAMERLGVAKGTVQRMAQDGRLPTFRDPRDKRVRLAKVDDVERLARLVPEE